MVELKQENTMSNMSYCRFRNTLGDLYDCKQALNEEGLDSLSDEEKEAAEELSEVCGQITRNFGDTEEDEE